MKIGILTLPLYNNYGGILQAFALKSVIEEMGGDVFFINRRSNSSLLKRTIHTFIRVLGHQRYSVTPYSKMHNFVKRNMRVSGRINSNNAMSSMVSKEKPSAIIVGSDQVWRSEFCLNCDYDYFLENVSDEIVKVAYAASFGVCKWMFKPDETNKIKELLEKFKAISVREESGVELCRQNLKIEAKHVLDPTMLLTQKDYLACIDKTSQSGDFVFVYWLGTEDALKQYLETLHLNDTPIRILCLRNTQNVLPSIEEWISYIYHAKTIVTDSFHGCVFSLIFHKDFYIYSNKSGGIGRLESLFNKLGIAEKLYSQDFRVDYEKIDTKLNEMRRDSLLFLQNSLNL